jgi:hypothetical protein
VECTISHAAVCDTDPVSPWLQHSSALACWQVLMCWLAACISYNTHWLCLQDGEGGEEGAEGDGIDILQDRDGPSQGEGQQRTGADRITTRYLTKFERARVLGTRALQIR